MLVKFKIKGLTNVPSFQEHIQGKAGDGFVYRNLGNRMELDIVRMFVFDLAGKLKKAGVPEFKVSNSPFFLGQTAAFWVWLSDRWRDYVEVEQVSEMKDRFSEAIDRDEETGDLAWYESPSGQSRRGKITQINQSEGYMVISDIVTKSEYTVAIHEDVFKPADRNDLKKREQDRPPLTIDDLEEINVLRGIFDENHSQGSKVADNVWVNMINALLKKSKRPFSDLTHLSDEILNLLMTLDDIHLDNERTHMAGVIKRDSARRSALREEKGKKSFTTEEANKLAKEQGYTGDSQEFAWGLDIELEHGTITPDTNVTDDDPTKTAKIALAHLNEIPDYYTRLRALEKAGKAAKKG